MSGSIEGAVWSNESTRSNGNETSIKECTIKIDVDVLSKPGGGQLDK